MKRSFHSSWDNADEVGASTSYAHFTNADISHSETVNVFDVEEEIEKLLLTVDERFIDFMNVKVNSNGGAAVLSTKWPKIRKKFDHENRSKFVREFIRCSLAEVQGSALFALSVIEGAMKGFEDCFEYVAKATPQLAITFGSLKTKQNFESSTFSEYYSQAKNTCHMGTFQHGPLQAISLIGQKKEQNGYYFQELLNQLQLIEVFEHLMPWSNFTTKYKSDPCKSSDGPILWVRPGEQTISMQKESEQRKRSNMVLTVKRPLGFRAKEVREILFEDRTYAHVDHVGDGFPIAAVGFLQAVRGYDEIRIRKRDVKDVICFHAVHMEKIIEVLKIDPYEPPATQCLYWVDEGKLNQLRREGVMYARMRLRDEDAYIIPRKVIHQFRTLSACCSVAWHYRYKLYYQNEVDEADFNMEILQQELDD